MLQTRSELQAVRAQIAALKRSSQVAQLAQSQVHDEIPSGTVWHGVGKMFMAVSLDEYDASIKSRVGDIDDRLVALSKKEEYFRTSLDKLIKATTG